MQLKEVLSLQQADLFTSLIYSTKIATALAFHVLKFQSVSQCLKTLYSCCSNAKRKNKPFVEADILNRSISLSPVEISEVLFFFFKHPVFFPLLKMPIG